MSARYKVLSAMLALRTFTVDELAKCTGVKTSTIGTVLNRDRSLLEQLGWEETGRRGGQPKRYQLKPEQVGAVEATLKELYPTLEIPSTPTQESRSAFEIPLGLLVAEDVLLNDYAKAQSLEEKEQLFNLALIDLEAGRGEARLKLATTKDEAERDALETSLRKVEAVEEMCRAQLAGAKLALEIKVKKPKVAKAVASAAPSSWPVLSEVNEHISKAIGNLHYLYNSMPHSNEATAFDETEFVLLIDGINEQPDQLTDYVRDILSEHNISTEHTDKDRINETGRELYYRHLTRGKCLLTINSGSNYNDAKETCQRVLGSCDIKNHVYVVDLGSDDRLRNWILEDNANYINYARQLHPQAMLAALRLRR